MLERVIKDGAAMVRLRSTPVGPALDSFCEWSLAQGYAPTTLRQQISFLGSFGGWLKRSKASITALDEGAIDRFLAARSRGRHVHRSHRRALILFLGFVRTRGIAAPPARIAKPSPVEVICEAYEDYLRNERGLSSATVLNYVPFARKLISERFATKAVEMTELVAHDISAFVLRYARSMSPGRAKLMVTALRSFLTFLFLRGDTQFDLTPSVPTVADWRRSHVPKFLEREQIAKILATCDRKTAKGRRDYAVMLLLARLGLRAGEVVKLELDDIDWRSAEIDVRGKGSSRGRLPLLADVGDALACYIRHDRPPVDSRRVFIRARAPLQGFKSPSAVTTIVERAIERAGLRPATRGAHLLRHSLATELLRKGASMVEIGGVPQP